MGIRFDIIDVFIKFQDETRYLVLFAYSYCDKICDKIKYLISRKSGTTDSLKHNFARIRIDSYNSSPIEKILIFHFIILITAVLYKNKNNYYHNIFLEKGSYEDKSNIEYF